MAMHILRSIVKNIKKSSCYSIMADEITDIINKEQFVICIRWVDNDLNENDPANISTFFQRCLLVDATS